MLGALVGAPAAATTSADGDPSILSGTVTGFGGVTLTDGVEVDITDATSHVLIDSVPADHATGAWTSDSLSDGSYDVHFTPASTH